MNIHMKTSGDGDWYDGPMHRKEPDPVEEKKPVAPLSLLEKIKVMLRKESTITFPKK